MKSEERFRLIPHDNITYGLFDNEKVSNPFKRLLEGRDDVE